MRKKDNIKILKIGGSVITDKSVGKIEVAKIQEINRIAEEIANSNTKGLILIHGAGSFGHPYVKKYKLDKIQDLKGISKTHLGCKKLNLIFCSILLEKKINALPLDPISFFKINNNEFKFDYAFILKMLEKGFVPVLHGDMIYNQKLDIFEVISGDRIIYELAKELKPGRIGFAVDKEVIINGKPIKEINNSNFYDILSKVGHATGKDDVTGGMKEKVRFAAKISNFSEVFIFSGTVKGNITRFLNGERVGTSIKIKDLKVI